MLLECKAISLIPYTALLRHRRKEQIRIHVGEGAKGKVSYEEAKFFCFVTPSSAGKDYVTKQRTFA